MVHHQQHGSLGGSRFAPVPPQDARRGEPVASAAPTVSSQPYVRYASTPGPAQQARDPAGAAVAARSYTPASAFDPRGPPQGYMGQETLRDAQIREAHIREAQMREAAVTVRDPREQQSILARQLRPQDPYDRGVERRY